jgi:hypothetical protein
MCLPFLLSSLHQDVVIAVTPFFGDPDIYVSTAPVIRPSRGNYTWVAASYGKDVLTLQARIVTSSPSLSVVSLLSLLFYFVFCFLGTDDTTERTRHLMKGR